MRAEARFCDLCACDGEAALAVGIYATDGGVFDLCKEHGKQQKKGVLQRTFRTPGELPENVINPK